MESKARRRRHVPAFGEWNYHSSSSSSPDEQPPTSGTGAAAWYAPAEPEACSDVWFRYSPPPLRPAPKKLRTRPVVAPEKLYYGGGGKGNVIVVPGTRARSSGSSGGLAVAARTPVKGARRVVRPVDEDLYQVPPPDLVSGRSGMKKKSLWTGCLGLNCVA